MMAFTECLYHMYLFIFPKVLVDEFFVDLVNGINAVVLMYVSNIVYMLTMAVLSDQTTHSWFE